MLTFADIGAALRLRTVTAAAGLALCVLWLQAVGIIRAFYGIALQGIRAALALASAVPV